MYDETRARIESLIKDGYEFRFSYYLERGFHLLQQNLGGFIIFTLLYFVIYSVIQAIPYLGSLANSLVVTPALMAGVYLVSHRLNHGTSAQFSDFFKGFDFIGQLAVTMVIYSAILLVSLIPFILVIKNTELFSWYIDVMQDPSILVESTIPAIPLWMLCLLLPTIYLSVAYSWAVPFVIFYDMQPWDALETSRKLITKKWLVFFLFTTVTVLIAMAGIIALCIGVLATFPAMYCIQYAAFEDVTGLNGETGDEINIEEHLVD